MAGNLELKLKNFLGQHVDLRVLLVDLPGEFLKLGCLTNGLVWCRCHRLRDGVKIGERGQHGQDGQTRDAESHGNAILPLASRTGKRSGKSGSSVELRSLIGEI
jgi:hypothetical protein